MDNHEDYLDALTAYARNPSPEIPPVLDQYLNGVAKNGETLFQWPLLKPLIVGKMEQVIQELSQGLEAENIPTRPNVENVRFEVMHARIMDAVHKFTGAPFTIQRLCELLMEPKRHYKRSDKFMRGLEKNVLVVSTVDPFGRKVVSESSSKPMVNGMDSSSSPFLPHSSTPLPPVPDWVTSRPHTTDSSGATQESSITTNGVGGGLVTSVYTDQGEQPMAVHAEEVVEETVVTMETNEVATVSDGGEAMVEEEEEEMVAGEDTNASSSSSSSSSSEELSISDSSDSSTPAVPATSVSSSTHSTASPGRALETEDESGRPWASLTSGEVATPTSGEVATPTSEGTSPSHTKEMTVQSDVSTSLPWWNPHTSAEPPTDTTTSATTTTTPRDESAAVCSDSEPNEVSVTTTTSPTANPKEAVASAVSDESSSKPSIRLEDSGGVNDVSAADSVSQQVVPEVAQEFVASSSSPPTASTILSPSSLPHTPYPQCDSVAGLERLVSSVDASSPITVLSSTSTHSPLSTPPSGQEEDRIAEEEEEERPQAKKSRLSESTSDENVAEEGPQAKKCRLSEEAMEDEESERDFGKQEDSRVEGDISSSTTSSQEQPVQPAVKEDSLSSSSLQCNNGGEEAEPGEADTVKQPAVEREEVVSQCTESSSTESGSEGASREESGSDETNKEESGSDEAGKEETAESGSDEASKEESEHAAAPVGSPPSNRDSSSSSDSEGFDVSAEGKGAKEESVPSTTTMTKEEGTSQGDEEAMDQD